MTNNSRLLKFPIASCLTDDDLYCYISGQGSTERLRKAEAHFAECDKCRRNLSELLEILQPDEEQAAPVAEPSKSEVDQTLAVIRDVAKKEHIKAIKRIPRWIQLPVAAAAALGFIALSLLSVKYFYEKNKSEEFFSQARAMLEHSYTGTSPGNLRLDLPFNSVATSRSDSGPESLRPAENLFFQALAVRENMVEAHLGLGSIYLSESKFDQARSEFQKVLDIRKGQTQALVGRGVAQYEAAVQITEPLQRDKLLKGALGDFDEVLKLKPESAEARYNKIWTLYESGLHKDALQEIDRYLARDAKSIWAEKLKGLQIKMKATQTSAVEDEVDRAARARDKAALVVLARQAAYQMPGAIWAAMRRSLAAEKMPAKNGFPTSEDLRWAADTMEAAYSAETGDRSFRAFIDFYNGLSPPEREIKKSLDSKFQSLVKLHNNGDLALTLRGTESLESQYAKIRDDWQLFNLHHLRGNCFYLGKADFRAAESEYCKMRDIAERLEAPHLSAMALRSLSGIYGEQRKFDQSVKYATKAKELAKRYKMELLDASASITLGNQYRHMGLFQRALVEYDIALSQASRLLDGLMIIEALENSGAVKESLGRMQEAGACYHLAIRQQDYLIKAKVLKPTPGFTSRRLNLFFKEGILALRTGDFVGAESSFQESLKSVPKGMSELEARNRVGLAEVYLRTHRVGKAESALNPAADIIRSGQYPEVEWQVKFMKGRTLEAIGRTKEALISYQESIKTLERMRQNVESGDQRQSFLIGRYEPFRAVADLLFRSSGDRRKLLEFVDKAKSATLKEHLKLLDPGAGFPAMTAASGDSAHTTIEYFFTPEKLLIFVTAEGKVDIVAQNISLDEMDHQIDKFLEYIKANDSRGFSEMAQRLYSELIAPIEDNLFAHKSETLVVLPDGPLYLLPFAGLQDKGGRFLIERTPIAFAPSRSIMGHCLLSDRGSSGRNGNVVLIDGSAGLSNARDELAYIANLYRGSALILGAKDMTATARSVEDSSIVHFSGHAVMRDGQPVLMLQKFPEEVYVDCARIRNWKMPKSKLVNLAGCSTGIGPIAEGESPWGLIPAFLDAGAPSIIASLTEVDDASTRRLSCQLYDLLKKGSRKAAALQSAQLTLLHSARSASGVNPQSWVPYILVGNPQ
jgi:CHAT domain-containing protein